MPELTTLKTLRIKLPWWYRARIATLAVLAKTGFKIDIEAEASAIVNAAKITAR